MDLAKKKLILRPPYFALQWHITERCNWHCRHCYQSYPVKEELPLGSLLKIFHQYLKLIHDLGALGKKNTRLTFTGGEPFLRQDFLTLLEKLRKYNRLFSLSILSNGSFIDPGLARELKKLKVDSVQLSLEGSQSRNDSLRGQGAFEKTMEAAAALLKAGIFTAISFTLTRENQSQLPGLEALCRKAGIKRLGVRRFIPLGRGKVNRLKMLEPAQLKRIYRYIQSAEERFNRKETGLLTVRGCEEGIFAQEAPQAIGACAVMEGRCLVVLNNADVVPCRRLPLVLGNALRRDLGEIYYSSARLDELRNLNNAHKACRGCASFSSCLSGAKCLSYAYFGNPYAPDPQCWKLFKALPPVNKFKHTGALSTRNRLCARLFGGVENVRA